MMLRTSGRSSVSGVTATVFGCTGFLGRYIVGRLGKIGSQVIIPYRGEEMSFAHLKVMGDLGQIIPIAYDIRDPALVRETVSRSNVVINLIGRTYETRNFSLSDGLVKTARVVAEAAAEAGAVRLIHMSCLGAAPDAPSNFARLKYESELQVLDAFPQATILRAAPIFGLQDKFLNKWGSIARYWPYYPIIAGDKRIQPLWVSDMATALLAALADESAKGQTYELAGPRVYTHAELAEFICRATKRENKLRVHVPLSVAKLYARVTEKVFRTAKFVEDEIDYQAQDLVVNPEAKNIQDLCGAQVQLGALEDVAAMSILRHYRQPQFLNMEYDEKAF